MAFFEELVAASQPRAVESHPFIIAVRSGTASRESIRAFALNIFAAAESFVRSLHAILSVCTDVRVRQSLLGNILEEEGATGFVPGLGVSFDPARNHPNMARVFARATGVSETELAAVRAEPPRWFQQALASRNWIGPFAYVAVGTEVNVPPTYRLLIPALTETYGFTAEELQFLIEHVTVDDRHGIEGAKLIASVADSDQARRQALDGARQGGVGWWQLLRKHMSAARTAELIEA